MRLNRDRETTACRAVWPLFLMLALGCAWDDLPGPPEDGGAGGSAGASGTPTGGGGTENSGGSGGTGGTTPRDAAGGAGGGGTGSGGAGAGRADGSVDPVDARSGDTGRGPDDARPDITGPRADGGSTTDAGSSTDGSLAGWTLVWSDEFSAASGTGADTTKWNLVNKGDGFGNNELQFYTNRPANAQHDGNGFLVIKAVRETYMGRQYTSARLESNGKFSRTYGRFETRMQLPYGQGIWPAFWMLGNDIGSAGWPTCGEIDVMENIGREPSILHGTLHGPGYSGGNPLGNAYTLPNGARFADGFHVFAVEWELNVVRWYMDDIQYGTKGPSDTPAGARWVYDHPFYLLLNLAVGGNWPGSPDATTVFPQTLTVDYVRVYSR